MLIAQITDLHIRAGGALVSGRVDTNAMLAAAVATLMALPRRPDVVLASGDLTDCGRADEYAALADLLAPLDMPVYLIPGNHDRREHLRAGFPSHGYLPAEGFLHYTVDDFPVKLVALDTVVPGAEHGELCAERLAWLAARLDERRDHPVVVFMHHPPFPTGLRAMDDINCRNGAALAEIVARHPNVERVLAGHHHRPIQVRWAGTIGSVAPSTAHQVVLDIAEPGDEARFVMEPPAFHLHLWRLDAGLITHQAYIGAFDGPHDFALDADYPGFRQS